MILAPLAALAPSAAAQDVDTEVLSPTGGVFVGDEPNVDDRFCLFGLNPATAGTDRTVWPDPSACAQEENNEFTLARLGEPTDPPGKILQARWYTTWDAPSDTNRILFTTFGGGVSDTLASGFLVGPGRFEAWYGHWKDLNGDGFIEFPEQSDGAPALTISADPNRPCNGLPTVDTTDPVAVNEGAVDGEPGANSDRMEINADDDNDVDDDEVAPIIAAGPEATLGVQRRCDGETEFAGIAGAKVVMYVTPGNFTDFVNGPTGFETGGTITPGASMPDYIMEDSRNSDDTQGASDGYYITPAAGFDQIWTDNGLLQTTMTETIADACFDPESGRGWAHGTCDVDAVARTSVTDADVYKSVSGDLEGLYNGNVGPIWDNNPLGANPDSWAPASGLRGAQYAAAAASPGGGAVVAVVLPPMEQELPVGKTLEMYELGYEGYARIYAHDSFVGWEPAVVLAADVPSFTTGTNRYFGLYSHVGIWKDIDGDGWLGNAEARAAEAGCADDAHACGWIQDPNQYFAHRSNGEFFETCISGQSGYPDKDQNKHSSQMYYFTATMTPVHADPSSTSWGSGIYVLSDNQRVQPTNTAVINQGGVRDQDYQNDSRNLGQYNQYSFNPWDDVVLDVLGYDDRPAQSTGSLGTPGKVDRLVTSGTVNVHMVCTSYSGTPYYSSYEHFLLPGGNVGFDIQVRASGVEFVFEGFEAESLTFGTTIPALI